LSEDLEITMAKSCTALPQICSLSAEVFVSRCFILLGRCGWRCRILGIEQLPTTLSMVYIAQEIEVVVKEVW